jgi:hypothetical protein
MYTKGKKPTVRPVAARASKKNLRVEIVDHSHARWAAVLKLIGRMGDKGRLLLDEDGWLSARQSVLAAFIDDKPTAYLIFHIDPVGDGRVEGRLDVMNFASAEATQLLSKELCEAALRQCRKFRCVRFKGLDGKVRRRQTGK